MEKVYELLEIIKVNCKGKMFYHSFYVLCAGLVKMLENEKAGPLNFYIKKYFAEYVEGYNPTPNGKYGVMDFADPDLVMYDITGTIVDFGYAVVGAAIEKGLR